MKEKNIVACNKQWRPLQWFIFNVDFILMITCTCNTHSPYCFYCIWVLCRQLFEFYVMYYRL